jgi:hypothetical protein
MARGAAEVAVAASPDPVAQAHARLLADPTLQFDFAAIPKPAPPPKWLEHLLHQIAQALGSMGPVFKYVFWGVLVIVALLIIAFIAREVIRIRFPKKVRVKQVETPVWRPTESQARALLEDADRLAGEGRFAEAVRLLLFRSIEDIQGHRPGVVRPALTSRDIAALRELPPSAQPAFAALTEMVERSFFGGRQVTADGFTACRQAYAAFALPEAWR